MYHCFHTFHMLIAHLESIPLIQGMLQFFFIFILLIDMLNETYYGTKLCFVVNCEEPGFNVLTQHYATNCKFGPPLLMFYNVDQREEIKDMLWDKKANALTLVIMFVAIWI